jgi:hypothetical protein
LKKQSEIDKFNAALRTNTQYQAFLSTLGVNLNGPLKLTDSQRKAAAEWVRTNTGTDLGKLQIDPAGNVNQDEGWSKHKTWAIPAAIGVGTMGLGAAGIGPMAGIMGAGGGGSAAAGAASGGVLASSSVPTSLAMGAVPGIGAGATAAGAAAGGSGAFGTLAGYLRDPRNIAGAAGRMLTGAASASAQNRGEQLSAEMSRELLDQSRQRDFQNAALQHEAQGRESAADAYKRERISQYLDSPQARAGYKPADISIAGTKMSSFGFGPQATSQAEVDAARQYAQQNAQGSFETRVPRPTDPGKYELDPDLLKGSTAERLSGYLGGGLSAYGDLMNHEADMRTAIAAIERIEKGRK